jgi:hypothetical protein
MENQLDIESNYLKSKQKQQYTIALCDSNGTPLQTKFTEIEPIHAHMNSTYIITASKSHFYIWNYQSSVDHSLIRDKKQVSDRYKCSIIYYR